MNLKEMELTQQLREQLTSDEEQKYALLVGNGFNKYQFAYNGLHSPKDCDWEAIIRGVAFSDEVKNLAGKKPELRDGIDRILDMPGIHPAERGIFLFDLLDEYGYSKNKTAKIVKKIIDGFRITPPMAKILKKIYLNHVNYLT